MHNLKKLIMLNPSAVAPEYRNRVVIQTIFRLVDGGNKTIKADRIELRSFVDTVVDDEREELLTLDNNLPQRCFPVSFYNEKLSFFSMKLAYFNALDNNPGLNERFLSMPDSEVIFAVPHFGESIGCQHYVRGCLVRCEECERERPNDPNNYFGCRLCHDALDLGHDFARYETSIIKCRFCEKIGLMGQNCFHCQQQLASYYCPKCRLLCGTGEDSKPNYHCDRCGFCRVGYLEDSEHCDACCKCFHKGKLKGHNCQRELGNCVVCMGSLENTIHSYINLPCKFHYTHSHCYDMMLHSGNYKCPLCRKLILFDDMKRSYERLSKEQFEATIIPSQFADTYSLIRCLECSTLFYAHKHIINQRCTNPECLSYNTQAAQDNVDAVIAIAKIASQQAVLKERGIEIPIFKPEKALSLLLNHCRKNYSGFVLQHMHVLRNGLSNIKDAPSPPPEVSCSDEDIVDFLSLLYGLPRNILTEFRQEVLIETIHTFLLAMQADASAVEQLFLTALNNQRPAAPHPNASTENDVNIEGTDTHVIGIGNNEDELD